MLKDNSARASVNDNAGSNGARLHTLLIMGALCLVAVGAQSIPQGKSTWVTLTAVDTSVTYAPAASEAACRSAQADPSVFCLTGSDLRSIGDERLVAQASIQGR